MSHALHAGRGRSHFAGPQLRDPKSHERQVCTSHEKMVCIFHEKLVCMFQEKLGWIFLAIFGIAGIVLSLSACPRWVVAQGTPASVVLGLTRALMPKQAVAANTVPYTPRLLSETGLYQTDGSLTIDSRNLPFTPQYPLWSDGAAKSRWIYLPAGTTIDVTDIDAWRFPVGTKLWKEFMFAGRKVETRMLWRPSAEDWVFATYVWAEDQTDAMLAPDQGIPGVVQIAPSKLHSIPSIADCNACHRSSPAVVLGFNALQLSDDRDPLAPHAEPLHPGMVTLRTLVESDRLDPPRPELGRIPPRVRSNDPVERAAIGYLSANCGGCHNRSGPLARLGLVLLHDVAGEPNSIEPALETAVDSAGRFVIPGMVADSSRLITPGAPERSAVLYRMESRRPSSQMPPLGTVFRDEEAAGLVRRWIAGLEPTALP